jgi:class 3 adenylate cyclase
MRLRGICRRIVDDPYVFGMMSLFTVWALFGSDIKQAATYKTADLGFEVIISIIFFAFCIENVMSMWAKPEYFLWPATFRRLPREKLLASIYRRTEIGSFYFYLDWISTLSLLFEIDWVTNNTLINSGNDLLVPLNLQSSLASSARTARILSLVRMIRLFRLAKLYKYGTSMYKAWEHKVKTSKKRKEAEEKWLQEGGDASMGRQKAGEEEEGEQEEESQVGAAMGDLTNRRVIVLILILLLVVPQLNGTPSDQSGQVCANFINVMAQKAYLNKDATKTYSIGKAYNLAVSDCLSNLNVLRLLTRRQNDSAPVYLGPGANLTSYTTPSSVKFDNLRPEERVVFVSDNTLNAHIYTTVALNIRDDNVASSLLSIYNTLFIIALLLIATSSFTGAIRELVIGPIESMVSLVQKISKNPLEVDYRDLDAKDGFAPGLETTKLLVTINKIGTLMRVGFGEAGASVIANNLSKSEGGRLNLIADGLMIRSIFGFCDVRQFTDTTECLQEEVMLFVNRIAHILHSIVVQCSGSANKNIGDAFLLTWKLNEGITQEQEANLADQALLCFCKALIELSRYQTYICNFTPAATQRLFKRFPGYVVRIGSGLHVGWAVEGAVGSNRKIDATYLSPHVNFTEFLESSTKAYGVPLLISEPFYKMLSPAAARYIRQVDRIKKEGEDPISMYTYDSDIYINWTEIDVEKERLAARQASKAALVRQAEETLKSGGSRRPPSSSTAAPKQAVSPDKKPDPKGAPSILVFRYTEEAWDDDEDLVQLRHHIDHKFREIW